MPHVEPGRSSAATAAADSVPGIGGRSLATRTDEALHRRRALAPDGGCNPGKKYLTLSQSVGRSVGLLLPDEADDNNRIARATSSSQ